MALLSTLIALSIIFYFLPSSVAVIRKHRQTTAIVVLNLLLGWTLVGWVVALVWALTKHSDETSERGAAKRCFQCGRSYPDDYRACPQCGVRL